MDGRGRWMDNVFIERLWRSLKYEDIYLKGYSDGHEAKAGIARWIGPQHRVHFRSVLNARHRSQESRLAPGSSKQRCQMPARVVRLPW